MCATPRLPDDRDLASGRSRAASLRLSAFGAEIELSGEIEAVAAALVAALPGARLDGDRASTPADVGYHFALLGDGGRLRLSRAGSELSEGDRDQVLARAVDELHFDVALHAREASFLHASVVSWQGRLLIFPGRTGSGKSTLAATLTERGATYYSDEYAPIDAEGRIVPYPKRISLRPDVRPRFGAMANGEPSAAAEAAVAPAAIVFTRFQAGARFEPQPLSVEAAALCLIDNSVVAAPRPRQAAAAVARLLAHRPRLGQGERGEAEDFAAELAGWLAAPP